jgi:hypothetical protein
VSDNGNLSVRRSEASDSGYRRIVWSLRSIARRERQLSEDARTLTEPELATWRAFAGRLHEGDLVTLLVENDAPLNPLALRPLATTIDAATGRRLIEEALRSDSSLITASTARFLEAAAVAFGKPPLTPERRSAFGPIRAMEQRILEFPSTAGRVAASVAEQDAPLERYVSYVVESDDDAYLIGLVMLEFERREMPTLIWVRDLEQGDRSSVTAAFVRAATLGGEEGIAKRFPGGAIGRLITL